MTNIRLLTNGRSYHQCYQVVRPLDICGGKSAHQGFLFKVAGALQKLTLSSTQYQSARKVTLHLAASTSSPGDGDHDTEYFAPRVARSTSVLDSEWGTGEELYLSLSVEDTGCGLNNEEMHRLFTRFTQASPKTHVRYGGSGLGLFICKELCELRVCIPCRG